MPPFATTVVVDMIYAPGAGVPIVPSVEWAMTMPLRPIVRAILDEYLLPVNGEHGVSHWARVLENGLRLCPLTGANVEVVRLFALFHDSRRFNEGWDPEHGPRGARFARRFRGTLFDLPDDDFDRLCDACEGHTHERTHPDVTVQTCYDADRLDLGRVGMMPVPEKLCTEAAKRRETILWADGRASFRVVPEFVEEEWGVDRRRR